MNPSQKQRWLTYGANVAVSCLLVVVLAATVVYLVQQRPRRIDTTRAGLYSLKPQTLAVIGSNESPIKLVSLYRSRDDDPSAADERRRAQVVRDLLLEYQRKGRNIRVEFIDPRAQPAKADALIADVERQYGGEIEAYRAFLDGYDAQHGQIVALCAAEVEALEKLEPPAELDRATLATFRTIASTARNFPSLLDDIRDRVERERRRRIPDYQGCAAAVSSGVAGLRHRADAIIGRIDEALQSPDLPPALREYLTESMPRYRKIRDLCDQVIDRIENLGDLKLDTLRRSLQQRDPILVMGQREIRILPFEQIWREPVTRDGDSAGARPRFAGEQMLTSAIAAVNRPKRPTVAFVRSGGAPLTDMGFPPLVPGGPFAEIAQRLREYEFDVVERDLSGQWAMAAQMRGMPADPEASDEQLAEAVWVVVAVPPDPRLPVSPTQLAEALRAHLERGGAALVMVEFRARGLESTLKDFGIEPRADLLAVHEAIERPDAGRSTDQVVDAQRLPFIFVLREHGDHAITRPLRSLDLLLVPAVPVITSPVPGVRTTPILPLPNNPPSWGEANPGDLQTDTRVAFDPETGDLAGPIFAGAVAQRDGETPSRLVVIGSAGFASDFAVMLPDEEMRRQGVLVSRFPANGELFMNSVFWLSGMEEMVAISPSAMEVSRIGPMTRGALNFWRVGVLLVGIPGAVVAAGLIVYWRRRD